MTREFLAKTKSEDGSSTPRASGISADLQQIALEYTQVTGKGLFGGHSELLRQNSQGALEAKGVDAAIRRLDNRDRIVHRLAQSIRAEDSLKEVTHQYELNAILREQKQKAALTGSPRTPSLPPAAAPASLPSPPVQPYASPDRLEGLALNGVLIYRTEGSESFARFAAALSHDLGSNEAAVVTRRMDVIGATLGKLGERDGHRVLTMRSKGNKERTVKIPVEVARHLEAWRAGVQGLREETPSTPLFCGLVKRGRGKDALYNVIAKGQKPLCEKAIWKLVARRVKQAGISAHITPHSTRHTFITLALDGGAPLHKVQVAAGHADPRTTERYWRTKENLDDNAVDYVQL